MLYGEHRCAMDEKGRLSFPAKFRELMGESFTVTRWVDNCLVAFPAAEWQRMAAQLKEKSRVKSRQVQRFLFAGASPVAPDKQGRILIPQHLREHAQLERDTIVIGTGDHAEIWNVDAWNEYRANMDNDAIVAAMEELEL